MAAARPGKGMRRRSPHLRRRWGISAEGGPCPHSTNLLFSFSKVVVDRSKLALSSDHLSDGSTLYVCNHAQNVVYLLLLVV